MDLRDSANGLYASDEESREDSPEAEQELASDKTFNVPDQLALFCNTLVCQWQNENLAPDFYIEGEKPRYQWMPEHAAKP